MSEKEKQEKSANEARAAFAFHHLGKEVFQDNVKHGAGCEPQKERSEMRAPPGHADTEERSGRSHEGKE